MKDRCGSWRTGTRYIPEGGGYVDTRDPVLPVRPDILAVAREQVLGRGERLREAQIREVLRTPADRLGELLALAHEVRLAWCGPEVEVEGIVSLKTGGCPEDCHFCSQSGQFSSPVRSVWLDIPEWSRRRGGPAPRARPSSASSPPFAHRTPA